MGKGYSPEQIVRKLREAEGKLTSGAKVPEVARDSSQNGCTKRHAEYVNHVWSYDDFAMWTLPRMAAE